MLHAPHVLLMGSTGRDSGKTLFACRVVVAAARRGPVVAAKVTTVREHAGECPRGGVGCGTCADIADRYVLTRETDAGGHKDTQRLLAAGASSVYWLRVLRGHLEEGAAALLEALGSMPAVCESNSLRTVLEPGLFLFLRSGSDTASKPTAEVVRPWADREITFDGAQFDCAPEGVLWENGLWRLRDSTAWSGMRPPGETEPNP